jgi:hypothetical protein
MQIAGKTMITGAGIACFQQQKRPGSGQIVMSLPEADDLLKVIASA